ncbi:MAG TPA: dipeptide epimerase [Gammaproteobacteria bacterium]|nr:dipeptide epimerase [Gammaproteobacteria bacterium]
MKIRNVSSRIEHFPLTRPYTIAFRSVNDVELGLVEVETESGLVGLGCASPEPHVTGESREACAAALQQENIAWLEGRDLRTLPALCRQLADRMEKTPAARAALDMALHDLLAQHLRVPLVEMLGRAHRALPTSITIGIKPVDATLAEAEEYLGRGFRVLKVKLGQALEEDLERLAKLRQRIGAQAAIRVDPNQGYSPQELKIFVERTADLEIEFLEQPMPANRVDALRKLPESVRRRVAADETLLDEADAMALVAPPPACGIFNIKLMKCGGVHAARRIADIADIAGVAVMWGCMDESIISISAALHAALASPATRYLDLDGSLDLSRDVVSGGFALEDGVLRTLDAPGLGLKRLE